MNFKKIEIWDTSLPKMILQINVFHYVPEANHCKIPVMCVILPLPIICAVSISNFLLTYVPFIQSCMVSIPIHHWVGYIVSARLWATASRPWSASQLLILIPAESAIAVLVHFPTHYDCYSIPSVWVLDNSYTTNGKALATKLQYSTIDITIQFNIRCTPMYNIRRLRILHPPISITTHV